MKGSSRRAVMYKLASSVTVSGGVTDDANLYITALRLDPTTKRLKVDATIGGTEAEDSAHASGDSGVFVLSVRQDTATQLAGTDGDYAPLITDANGRLHVLDANTAAIKTAVELIDNAICGSEMQVDVITMPTTTVTATNLDIRDLTSTDVVTVTGGAGQTADVKVTLDSESVAVTGTFWQATQPVSIAATVGVDVSDEATRLLGVVYGSQGAQLQQKVTSNDLIVTLDSESVAVTGTFWQTTQPVSLASVPSHDVTNAGTFATQATLQTGSAAIGKLAANSGIDIGDVDVTSIIPGTGATNLGKAIDTVTGATDTGVLALATRDDALSALTPIEGDNVQLRVDANGALWVRDDALDAALAGSELQVDIVGSLPAGTAAIGKLAANSGVDIGDVDVLTLPAITIAAAQTLATVTTVSTVTSVTAIANALPAGTNAIGKLAANTGVDIGDVDILSIAAGDNNIGNVDLASAIPAGTNAIGKLAANSGVDIGDVGLSGARTSGGSTLYKNIDVDETEDQIKATAGQVYWIHAVNVTTGVIYLKFYNATAANVTVGTTVPDLTFPVPANADSDGAGFTLSIPNGIAFGTAITIAGTTGVADNDAGAPAANALIVNLGYA